MRKVDNTLEDIVSALLTGGKETLHKPPAFACAGQVHEPFRICTETVSSDDEVCGIVRTDSWQFDGDRSDVHEVFSIVWAAVLRAFGLSSPRLTPEPHLFAPGEIGAVYLILSQCPWNLEQDDLESAQQAMNAWSAFIFHLLDDVFRWNRIAASTRLDPDPNIRKEPSWYGPLLKTLRSPDDASFLHRRFPLWQYFSSIKRGVTIVRMPQIRITHLKSIVRPFSPKVARGEDAYCLLANGIQNVVPFRAQRKATRVLSALNESMENTLVVPLDSHCLFIADKTIVAIQDDCGKAEFEKERALFAKRRANENSVFFADRIIDWLLPLDATEFEALSLDLIKREPGVVWAKPVGGTNDRDGGRDLLVNWKVPNDHIDTPDVGATTGAIGAASTGTKTISVLVQIKSRSKTIGKQNVQDIRDMLERYQAQAFFLIAYPRISAPLVDYLENLRKTTGLGTEWWEASDIEDRLRRHPDIALRYPTLVRLRALP